jgi:rhodopsin domain-containing protein
MLIYQSEDIGGPCILRRLLSLSYTYASSLLPFSPACKCFDNNTYYRPRANGASRPVAAYWHFPSPGRCIEEGYTLTALSALNTLSEVIVAALPIPVIFYLNMDRKTRWTVICLLCLGYLVAIVGIIRTVFAYIVFDTDDLTWWAAPYWITSEIEISVGMICASTPVLRPVFGRLARRYHLTRTAVMNSIHNRSFSYMKSAKSPEVTSSNHLSSYSTYWRPIDVEGIGVDPYGYTVTIIAGSNRKQPRTSCFRKSGPTSNAEKSLNQYELSNYRLEQPKPALLKKCLDIGGRLKSGEISWRTLLRRPESSSAPIEVTARQSVEIIEERVVEDDIMTERGAYSPKPDLRRSWSSLEAHNFRSFYIDTEIED